jgi:hypothetical protein
VFPNGENLERAVYVWGETMEQLLDNSTTRLNLRKPAKFVFDLNGRVVGLKRIHLIWGYSVILLLAR